MNEMKEKIRTVTIGERGQLVIPEDIRNDLGIKDRTTLVMIERSGEIIIKKESAVLKSLKDEDVFWKVVSYSAMKNAWDKKDDVWNNIYNEGGK